MSNISTLQIFDQNDQHFLGAKSAGFDQHFFRHRLKIFPIILHIFFNTADQKNMQKHFQHMTNSTHQCSMLSIVDQHG